MNNTKGIKRFIYDFKTFTPLLLNLTKRDFKVKYRRSTLGVLWSMLNPLLTMIVITQVFGILKEDQNGPFRHLLHCRLVDLELLLGSDFLLNDIDPCRRTADQESVYPEIHLPA